jgi:hypothetical protein
VIVWLLSVCSAFLVVTESAGVLGPGRAEPLAAASSCAYRLPIRKCVDLIGILTCPTSEAANGQRREWALSSESPTRILSGTVVNGDVDARTLQAAIEALPRRPERIVVVETKALPPAQESRLRDLDAFVLSGSRVIYLRRQGRTLLAAEYSGGPYVLMLAVIIWHEMAHAEGLDEPQAQQREEDLWKEFMHRGLVDGSLGLTYLVELRRRR